MNELRMKWEEWAKSHFVLPKRKNETNKSLLLE